MEKLLLEIPSELETEHLILRRYKKDDGTQLLALFERNENRQNLKEAVDEASEITTEKEAEIRIRDMRAQWIGRKRFVMGIWLKTSHLYIGEIWIEPKKWEVPSFELGYFLDSGYWNMGFAKEACLRSMEFIFNDLDAHKIIIITRDTNERSYRLAEALGFTKEGHHREASYKDGKRWGLLYYGMLRIEFDKLNRNGE
ncbi:MAG: N-acetyltransferase [Candidatus Thorarchaeota archaeon]|nr:N-acetyltransferase [Candidatus Thorarchaeota archaeon]